MTTHTPLTVRIHPSLVPSLLPHKSPVCPGSRVSSNAGNCAIVVTSASQRIDNSHGYGEERICFILFCFRARCLKQNVFSPFQSGDMSFWFICIEYISNHLVNQCSVVCFYLPVCNCCNCCNCDVLNYTDVPVHLSNRIHGYNNNTALHLSSHVHRAVPVASSAIFFAAPKVLRPPCSTVGEIS